MKSFKDLKGREWEISITIGSIMRVKDKLGIDLLDIEQGDPPLIQRLGTDDLLIAQILEALLAKQLSGAEDDLYDLFDGETLLDAQTCFYEELSNFFLQSGKTHKAGMIRKMKETIQRAIAEATQAIEQVEYGTKSGSVQGE